MNNPIKSNPDVAMLVEMAHIARREHWKDTSEESAGDKLAGQVTKAWQQIVVQTNPNYSSEVEVPGSKQKIDLVNSKDGIACEFKVSGKNAGHEFFKDVFKILAFNESSERKIRTLLFLTGAMGASSLRRGLGGLIVPLMLRDHGLTIEIHGIEN